nr:ectin-like isoform X1 [Crassostrea gigas]
MTKITIWCLIPLIVTLFFVHCTVASGVKQNGISKEKRFLSCNKCTGLRVTTCRYKEKYRRTTYRACGFLWRKRCKTGTTYFWKYKSRRCNKRCRVNGSWSTWSTWGRWGVCQETSCRGQQKRLRTRACTDPKPRNGGRRCRGSSFQLMSRSCKPVYSKVNGNWGSWGQWKAYGACSGTCGQGRRLLIRERTCNRPTPKCGGRRCLGQSIQIKYKSCVNNKKCKGMRPKMRMNLSYKTSKIKPNENSIKNETSPVITGDSVNQRNQTSE